jgi:siderophore synthetase component
MQLVNANLPTELAGQTLGAELFLRSLEDSLQQTAWSLAHQLDGGGLQGHSTLDSFQLLEQWSSLRDRPFHPTAKAKTGLNQQDYQRYMAEFGQPVALRWVALRRAVMACGLGVDDPQKTQPANYLLTGLQQEKLAAELRQRSLENSHVALPIHPWQLEQALPRHLAAALDNGDAVVLGFSGQAFWATSSVRSMAPLAVSEHFLKLPLAIYSLGASRYLPAVKMVNGQRSEALLHQALARDSQLAQRVFICDETKWWAYMPEGATLFDDPPRHLSAMVRSYPRQLLDDPDCRLVPMAALGTPPAAYGGNTHFFDDWLSYRQLPANSINVLQLFTELCEAFFDINLRFFRLGMLPEAHGQNAVLVWRAGQAAGLLLRDHDSLRLHVPTLEAQGMADPHYCIKPGHANTLYHERSEDLLFYLQTLAIQVNLRAIIETLATHYHIPEVALWQQLRLTLGVLITELDVPSASRQMLERELFESAHWPLKLLVRPLIERAGGPGSMPFGKSQTINPFRAAAAQAPAEHPSPITEEIN